MRILAVLALLSGGLLHAQEPREQDLTPEPLPPPPPRDTPEPPAVPPVPEPDVPARTPTPAELERDRETPGDAGEERSAAPWWQRPSVADRLGITAEQANTLDSALRTYAEARGRAAAGLLDARRDLLSRLEAGDAGAAGNAVDAWRSAQHAIVDARSAYMSALIAELDGEQLRRLVRLVPGGLVPGGRQPAAAPRPAPPRERR